ncbi:prolipoprotein diacylglyceryl transferase [Stratiformator vulcanicus]|uniref:Prolipoprotein diacylglyceryl transferase n=1 Tax=Stratiformator vulcanicus TaxID=2527980 RepID=A0A517R7L8_9PLAN|nr:prolipoprotein diacylglyceryl transferase family protein [Stratiformator vulcanicus]QDT39823.1 Prolipoprotein diacylglyceryl transferase [Stratiformator vulcanicus]
MPVPPAYPLIMLCAVAAGILLSRGQRKSLGLSRAERFAIALGAFCGAMVGAKVPFLLYDLEGFATGTAWLASGKTILGGLVGGYLGVELAKWSVDVKVSTGDTYAVAVPTSIAIGRLGCFVAGCCFGTPSAMPWAVTFGELGRRHPTQLYESAFHLLCAIALWGLRRDGMLRGHLIQLYIIGYCGYRFATEFIRPEPRLWGGLTGYQWAAGAIMMLLVGLWIWQSRSASALAGRNESDKISPQV